MVFVAHIEGIEANNDEVTRLVEWIHTLHPTVKLEATILTLKAPWSLWAHLKDFNAFAKVFGSVQQRSATNDSVRVHTRRVRRVVRPKSQRRHDGSSSLNPNSSRGFSRTSKTCPDLTNPGRRQKARRTVNRGRHSLQN